MSTTKQQSTIIDAQIETNATIETSGRVIRPGLEIPTALVDECKLNFNHGGISMTAVDPANVGMVLFNIHKQAFETYQLEESDTVGVNLDKLTGRLSSARIGKSTDDPVSFEIDGNVTRTEITRDYDGTTITRTSEWMNIDPDSIRQEPDLPDVELNNTAELSPKALEASLEAIDQTSDHVEVSQNGAGVGLRGHEMNSESEIEEATAVTLEDVADEVGNEDAVSTFSMDYLKDMAKALVDAKVDGLTIRWDDEFPIYLDFERTDDDGDLMYDGRFMLAPRIRQENDI